MKLCSKSIVIILLVCCLITPSLSSSASNSTSTIKVTVANLKDADSMFVECNKEYMIIDTGRAADSDAVINMFSEKLKAKTVKGVYTKGKVKALVITHYDFDHVGGISKILQYFTENQITLSNIYSRMYTKKQLIYLKKCGEGYVNKEGEEVKAVTYKNYIKFLNAVQTYLMSTNKKVKKSTLKISNDTPVAEVLKVQKSIFEVKNIDLKKQDKNAEYFYVKKINWKQPSSGNNAFKLGNAKVQWLNRAKSYLNSKDSKNLTTQVNKDSLICKVHNNNPDISKRKSILFLGDIGKQTLEDQFKIEEIKKLAESTVVKISHHGFKSNNSQKLMNLINPKFAIVTTNKKAFAGNVYEVKNKRLASIYYFNSKKNKNPKITIPYYGNIYENDFVTYSNR